MMYIKDKIKSFLFLSQRRLCSAAKKALSKIPTKNIKSEDKEIQGDGECCAVCIEPYKVSDVLRILPCSSASPDDQSQSSRASSPDELTPTLCSEQCYAAATSRAGESPSLMETSTHYSTAPAGNQENYHN
ncbi:hypothetical protein C0J52_12896 [Blattella germanica]|nr:hypothetical protein C0J52_12896 [Blattella germanica]